MALQKDSGIRKNMLEAIKRASTEGIFQKDLQKNLAISKSYCSEQLAYLSDTVRAVARRKEGGLVKVYLLEFFPGPLSGIIRVGMLRSSEYIPSIIAFKEVFESTGNTLIFRFFDGTRELFHNFNSGSLEFMLAPTQAVVMDGVMSENLKILAGLASGGSGILSIDSGKTGILSTELSSMISLASELSGIELPEEIVTFSDPDKAKMEYMSGSYNMIAIWEPYFFNIKEHTLSKEVTDYNDVLGDFPCCCAAVHQEFYTNNKEAVEKWEERYIGSVNREYSGSSMFGEAVEEISRRTGIEASVVEKSLGHYNFRHNSISIGKLRKLGVNLSSRQITNLFLPGVLTE